MAFGDLIWDFHAGMGYLCKGSGPKEHFISFSPKPQARNWLKGKQRIHMSFGLLK